MLIVNRNSFNALIILTRTGTIWACAEFVPASIGPPWNESWHSTSSDVDESTISAADPLSYFVRCYDHYLGNHWSGCWYVVSCLHERGSRHHLSATATVHCSNQFLLDCPLHSLYSLIEKLCRSKYEFIGAKDSYVKRFVF